MKVTSLALLTASVLCPTGAWANHPVFVEGNCLVPPAGTSSVPSSGTCGDYDGDGRIGRAEDNDGDRVFGTLRAALGAGGTTGANQNGNVTIVTSGVFAERVFITAENGNVTLQAAAGVEAIVDAVLQGDPNGGTRQAAPGIVVNSPADRQVTIRNLTIRNWRSGIQVAGVSVLAIENCRLENNVNYGIEVNSTSKVKIDQSQILATGFRASPAGNFPTDNPPSPGIGIAFRGGSSGAVFRTEVSGSFSAGISRASGSVRIEDSYFFNNNPDREGFDEDADIGPL